MHRALRRIRYLPTSTPTRRPFDPSWNILTAGLPRFSAWLQPSTSLATRSAASSFSARRLFGSGVAASDGPQKTWSPATTNESTSSSKPLEQSKDGELGQGESRRNTSRILSLQDDIRSDTLKPHELRDIGLDTLLNRASLPEPRKVGLRYGSNDLEAWDRFVESHCRGDFSAVIDPNAEPFRDNILAAALNNSSRMLVFYEAAQHLRDELGFEWPKLYIKVLHFYLDHAKYETAYLWHLRLMPNFTPNIDDFSALLADCALDPTRELQAVLKRLYVLSPRRRVYDHLIPTLFEHGQSQTARAWRKQLVLCGDLPSSPASRPFLQFCVRYFPLIPLTRIEVELASDDWAATREFEESNPSGTGKENSKWIYSDSFTARWFASSWISVEFAVNLMHKLGLRIIGPRSLQSLALREESVEDVASLIDQLEVLGIAIAPDTYSKSLVSFAKEHKQALLTELLLCDIHPEEFADPVTRRMLMRDAKRHQDQKREDLLLEVEWATMGRPEKKKRSRSDDLNQMLKKVLAKNDLAKARLVLDKMEAWEVSMSQANSAKILANVFQSLWVFPKKAAQRYLGLGKDPNLDRAIHVIRVVARHDVAIPLQCWRIILYNLGRLSRFEELEELSYQIVGLYHSPFGGLFPVHEDDLPPVLKAKTRAVNKIRSNSRDPLHEDPSSSGKGPEDLPEFLMDDFWRNQMGLEDPKEKAAEKLASSRNHRRRDLPAKPLQYIPSDLPLSNQQHPIAKLFDPPLQRAIVRWGFDKKLAVEAEFRARLQVTDPRAADFDVAWGVHFLATLRSQGLHIDRQALKSTIISRIAVAQLPGRKRHRSRDDRELSPHNLKLLIDQAWGTELLPPLPHFIDELENHKPKVWENYPHLLANEYDQRGGKGVDANWTVSERQDQIRDSW
ncbi:hypothetical protein AK830_g3015 [Neonectria ditissima]|uniref:Pentatricopeptide repeat domain-containing protein n=1 Tax=Neonectria ditissima TaxID=78410 RepID=A0A0P7B9W4_9HYPO|nr:hypothetical protein AK830_g3015 [Neonectria ditissima]